MNLGEKMKLLIFDVDGTILYTLESIGYYLNRAILEQGYQGVELESVRRNLGNGSRVLIEGVLKELGVEDEKIVDNVIERYHKMYNSNASYLTEHYPKILELLDSVQSNILVAYSNKPDLVLQPLMKVFFDKRIFSFIQGQKEGVANKPNPDVVFELMKKYGVSKNDVYFIGDSEVDIATGKNAGVNTIGVTWGYRDRDVVSKCNPDYLVDTIDDLKELLCKIS